MSSLLCCFHYCCVIVCCILLPLLLVRGPLILNCCMTVATTIGTVVAYLLVPMRSLGQDSWKIAAALMSRHIGGGIN